MRRFSSYGPVSKTSNYYVPRTELIKYALLQLIGESPDEGGHYITVWAPRQAGKTWIMREILWILQEDDRFDVMYLSSFINGFHGEVYPEFPTGNGKIDLIIKYKEKIYGIELKTYTNAPGYKEALKQAAKYGRQLGLDKISLIFFVETINDESREKYEADFEDEETGVRVEPVFVATGH